MQNPVRSIMPALLLCAAVPGVCASNTTMNVQLKNLGKAEFSYMRSYGGMMAAQHISPELPPDSCVTIDLGAEGTMEHVYLLVRDKGRFEDFDIYVPAGETCSVTVDPTAAPVYTSSLPASAVAAISAAKSGYQTYLDMVMGKSDRLGLRKDSIAASVVKKLTALSDSAETVIAGGPADLVAPLRQQLRLGLIEIMDECAAGWNNRGISEAEGARWAAARDSLHAWANLDAPDNALSTIYRQALSHDTNQALFKAWASDDVPSREWINRQTVEFYRDNLVGKNAEAMMAAVVIHDSRDNRFTEGIPALAGEFRSIYPSSPLLPVVEASAAENARRNAPRDMEGINFVDASDVSTVAELVSRYKGRPVLLDLWATWCGPCRESFSKLDPVRKAAVENGVVLLYLSIDKEPDAVDKVRKVVSRLGVKGEHVVAGEDLYKDVFATFGTPALFIPHTALYGPDGTLMVKKFESSEDPDALASDLVRALKGEK